MTTTETAEALCELVDDNGIVAPHQAALILDQTVDEILTAATGDPRLVIEHRDGHPFITATA